LQEHAQTDGGKRKIETHHDAIDWNLKTLTPQLFRLDLEILKTLTGFPCHH
jgi:hypothetical protein